MTTTLLASFPSPSQGVWHLGPLPIRAYAFFIIAGIVVALIIGERRWQQRGGEPGTVYDMVFWAVGFGLIGGRLYHVITDWDKYFTGNGPGIVGALRIWDGGLGIWGAVALGGVGAWIGCRRRGIPLPAFGDAIAPGIILAQAIGRLGNYFNQELYGGPTTLPWGLEIYERSDASGAVSPHLVNGVSTGQVAEIVHPTFLYELLWNLLVFAALIYIDRRFKIGHGRLFAMYVAGYCFGRFWIELMRVDEANGFAGIRINSFTSTFVFIGAVIYIMAAPKGREDPATLKGTPTEAEDKAKDTEEEETSIEEFVKELTGVAATTTGLVAAAKVAGEAEDEDAKAAAGDETEGESETHSEAAAEAEALAEDVAEAPSEDIAEAEEFAEAKAEAEEAEAAEEEAAEADEAEELGADVAGVPADDIAEAEEFAAEGEEEPEGESETHLEAAAEAEALVEDVAEAPSEDIAEAEEFADAKAEAEEAESVGGVGAVEGEEAVEAEEAAPEVHDAAVEAAEEAEDVAAEVTDAAADDEQQADGELVGAEGEDAAESEEAEGVAAELTDAAADDEQQVDAELADAEGEDAAESEDVAAELTDAAADAEQQPEFDGPIEAADEAEAVEAEAAVEEAEGEPSEEEAAEVAEAVVAEVEAIEEQEPEAQVLADENEPESTEESEPVSDEPENEPAEESGGRLRRWMRGRRNR